MSKTQEETGRLRAFDADGYVKHTEMARTAAAELEEILQLCGMPFRNAAAGFLEGYAETLRIALTTLEPLIRAQVVEECARIALDEFAKTGMDVAEVRASLSGDELLARNYIASTAVRIATAIRLTNKDTV